VLKFRARLAQAAIVILKANNLHCRQYYRLINELGGFAKLDLSSSPKFSILDLDSEKLKTMEQQLTQDGIILQLSEEKSSNVSKSSKSEIKEDTDSDATLSGFEASKINENETLGDIGFEGPTLM